MNIALFGATGGTGQQILLQALDQGHRVKALAREPAKLPVGRDGLTTVRGDVLDRSAVDSCLKGTDAAICVLGSRVGSEPIEAHGTRSILDSMQTQGVRRLIAITSLGVGDSRQQVPFFFRIMMQIGLKKIMAAKEEQEKLIRATDLEWTIVRPGGLTDGPRTGVYTSGIDKRIKALKISRADVADFVLKELADGRFLRQTPAVA